MRPAIADPPWSAAAQTSTATRIATDKSPSWSPDGLKIVYRSTSGEAKRLVIMEVASGGTTTPAVGRVDRDVGALKSRTAPSACELLIASR
jgi:Tol biopolymer transport system component